MLRAWSFVPVKLNACQRKHKHTARIQSLHQQVSARTHLTLRAGRAVPVRPRTHLTGGPAGRPGTPHYPGATRAASAWEGGTEEQTKTQDVRVSAVAGINEDGRDAAGSELMLNKPRGVKVLCCRCGMALRASRCSHRSP